MLCRLFGIGLEMSVCSQTRYARVAMPYLFWLNCLDAPRLLSARELGTLIHGGYFTRQFYGVKGVNQFQIIQETLKHCVLKVVVNRQWTEATGRYLIQCIQKALGGDVVVTVEFVDEIPVSASGKREYTISKVGADVGI